MSPWPAARAEAFRGAGQRLLLTVWVGTMWGVGYLAVPVLFRHLDRVTAGALAGQMFTAVNLLGLLCGALLLGVLLARAGRAWHRAWQAWALLVMLALTALNQFGLQPLMEGLKQLGLDDAAVAARFGRLHGVSSALYLTNSLLGLVLVASGWRDVTPKGTR